MEDNNLARPDERRRRRKRKRKRRRRRPEQEGSRTPVMKVKESAQTKYGKRLEIRKMESFLIWKRSRSDF